MIAIILPCSYIRVENVKSILVLGSSNNGLNRGKNLIHGSSFALLLASPSASPVISLPFKVNNHEDVGGRVQVI